MGALTLNLDDGGLTLNVAMVTAGHGRRRPGVRPHHSARPSPPARGDAYRAGAADRRPRVCAVPSPNRSQARPGRASRPLAHHRGAARRGPHLRNAAGERFMTITTSAPSWPRAMWWCGPWWPRCVREGRNHVYLDATHLDAAMLQNSASPRSPPASPSTGSTLANSSSPSHPCATTWSAGSLPTCGVAPPCRAVRQR